MTTKTKTQDQPSDKQTKNQTEINLEQIAQQAKTSFLELTTEEQQDVFFNMLCDRVYWRLVYYIRRYPERLISSEKTYTDRCIGAEEFMTYMGYGENHEFSSSWLELNHVPPIEEARNQVILIETQINAICELNQSMCSMIQFMHHFGLNSVEMAILSTLVTVMSVDGLLRLMTVAWADFSVRMPTVTFICQLLSDTPQGFKTFYRAFSETGILRRFHLIITEKHPAIPNHTPIAYAQLAVDQAVIDVFCGRNEIRELPPNMTLHHKHIPLKSLISDNSRIQELQYALKQSAARICLSGLPHSGRRTIACSIASTCGYTSVLEVDLLNSNDRNHTIEETMAVIMREAMMDGALLMLRMDGLDNDEGFVSHLTHYSSHIKRLIRQYPSTILLLTQKLPLILNEIFNKPVMIPIQPPSVEMANKVWHLALEPWTEPSDTERMADVFSKNYSLPVGRIFEIVRDALETLESSGSKSVLQSHHILNEIRKGFRHQLGTLAEITVSDVPLSGVVLPEDIQNQVDEILAYSKNLHNVLDNWGFRQRSPYGNALSVLFAGPPGTGKTLLACALANELGKVLYRVDLSRIVDKYIGETEKNLGKIFEEAEKAQAIILFDEADSLFSKRTDVKSSNDRYSNLEVNYLLQKLESYNGITILTSNLSSGIDEAFRRRLRFIIDFPMPDEATRVTLWKRMMPPNAPLADDIRWKWLARTFEMSGGYIRNAVLKAAIVASSHHKPISMAYLVEAAKDEARSMGKLMRISDTDYTLNDE